MPHNWARAGRELTPNNNIFLKVFFCFFYELLFLVLPCLFSIVVSNAVVELVSNPRVANLQFWVSYSMSYGFPVGLSI